MVYILLGTGFEPIEAIAPCDLLRRGGVEVRLAGIGGRNITGGHGITVQADCTVEEIEEDNLEMVVLPGGLGGVEAILGSETALRVVKNAYRQGKFVCAICAAPTVLAKLGLLEETKAVCYPGMENLMAGAQCVSADTVRDGMILTGRAAGASLDFGLALLQALRGEETARGVQAGIVYRV